MAWVEAIAKCHADCFGVRGVYVCIRTMLVQLTRVWNSMRSDSGAGGAVASSESNSDPS